MPSPLGMNSMPERRIPDFTDFISFRFHGFLMQSNFIYGDTTEKIIGCAMQVHSFFGLGFPELIYKRSLSIGRGNGGLKCKCGIYFVMLSG